MKVLKKLSLAKYAVALFAALSMSLLALAQSTSPTPKNELQSISFSTLPGGRLVLRMGFKEALPAVPAGFAVSNPPRIALDFLETGNALGKNSIDVGEAELRNINVVQSGTRTRMVLNLNKATGYETKLDGKTLLVTLQGGVATSGPSNVSPQFSVAKAADRKHSVKDIDFRRGPNGEGRVVVDLSDANAGIDIRRQGRNVVIDILNTSLPETLERRLDVTDFGTPVRNIETTGRGGNVHMVVEPQGMWEHSAYQTDNQFILEVKKIVEDPNKLVQSSRPGYAGEKLSLNFQNVEIRSVLQVIADFTGFNIIASDTVAGNITLRLKDVPWDQALDIILQSKNLSKRKNGNVILVAPSEELAAKEKLALEATQQIQELEQLQTETFTLSYHKAEAFKNILSDDKQKILSKRGSAVIDERTNTLFIQDIPSRLEEVRRIIAKVDTPLRQVMIEARIVIADDKFSRQLGVRFGNQSSHKLGGEGVGIAGNASSSSTIAGFGVPPQAPATSGAVGVPNDFNVNLPVSNPAGSIALSFLNLGSGNLVNIELSALEADGRGKVVSSPRVITADKQKATIEQGTEIPYLEASSSGSTSISFKSAVLSLAVTPQITPDGKVILDLEVKKDSVGQVFAGVPSIDTKKVITQILMDDGETAVLGGIYEQVSRDDVTKVPVLGNIPYLGNLFRNKRKQDDKTELLIFITPKVMKEAVSIR